MRFINGDQRAIQIGQDGLKAWEPQTLRCREDQIVSALGHGRHAPLHLGSVQVVQGVDSTFLGADLGLTIRVGRAGR